MSLSTHYVKDDASAREIAVVSLPGRLDAANVPHLSQNLDTLVGGRSFWAILDMTDVQFLDSSGLGLLVSVLKKCRAGGGNCSLCCLSPEVSSTLNLTALDAIFTYFETVERAIAAFSDPPSATPES